MQGKREGGGVLTAFIVLVNLLLMADGKRPRDEGSSAPPHGLPRVCRELFRGRYFSTPSSFIYPYISLCCVCDDACVVVGCRCRVPERGWRGKVALGHRAAPLPPAPLCLVDLRCRAALERLLLLPVVRHHHSSRPR